MNRMSKARCKTTIESGVSLEAVSLFLRGRCKAFYILFFLDITLALLLVGFSEYDDESKTLISKLINGYDTERIDNIPNRMFVQKVWSMF
ncbi:hypothetical protein Hanom_Chr06g00481651 [Helianthus anomalus]